MFDPQSLLEKRLLVSQHRAAPRAEFETRYPRGSADTTRQGYSFGQGCFERANVRVSTIEHNAEVLG
jgi:hypothetical protein